MSETRATEKPPLDELMLAMDVVDTLRHRERVVERALSAEARDRELIARLKEIYAGQGIAVSDSVLEQGVEDLRANRFVYAPPQPSLSRALARVYVSRTRWGKPLGIVVALVAIVLAGYQTFVRGPALEAIAALPGELDAAHAAVVELAEPPEVDAEADALAAEGRRALERGDPAAASAAIDALDTLHAALDRAYMIRVRSARGELSGVWRVPEANPEAENYYLIVEAIDTDGDRLTLPIVNEEDGQSYRVSRWGQRVDEALFQAVANDKRDDGIIQSAVIGEKARGRLEPEFRAGVDDGAITAW